MEEKLNKLDIYFEEKYVELSLLLEEEGSEVFIYSYEDENGKISNYVIKRPINIKIDDNKYFDIITPYGYGGPIIEYINQDIKDAKLKLLENFEKDFTRTCIKNNIIAEFVRFHPIIENALDFKKMYEPQFLQHTVRTICDKGRPFEIEFSKSAKKNIKKALEEGIYFEVLENQKDINDFKKIYYDTMDRKEAKDFYYFSDEYFDFILNNFEGNYLIINIKTKENITIASGIYFIYNNKYIHTHLSGTKREYLIYSPAYLLRYALSEWAYNKGYELIHHGGGTSPDLDNSLFLFKRRFTKTDPLDYYIAKKIYNNVVYERLVKRTKTEESNFFPQYRDPNIVK